jgi:hypothetical protein
MITKNRSGKKIKKTQQHWIFSPLDKSSPQSITSSAHQQNSFQFI